MQAWPSKTIELKKLQQNLFQNLFQFQVQNLFIISCEFPMHKLVALRDPEVKI